MAKGCILRAAPAGLNPPKVGDEAEPRCIAYRSPRAPGTVTSSGQSDSVICSPLCSSKLDSWKPPARTPSVPLSPSGEVWGAPLALPFLLPAGTGAAGGLPGAGAAAREGAGRAPGSPGARGFNVAGRIEGMRANAGECLRIHMARLSKTRRLTSSRIRGGFVPPRVEAGPRLPSSAGRATVDGAADPGYLNHSVKPIVQIYGHCFPHAPVRV